MQELNRKIVFWGLPDDEYMTHKTIDGLIADYLDANFGKDIPEEIIIYGYTFRKIKTKEWWAEWLIEKLIEHMDQEYMVENDNTALCDDSAIKETALELIDIVTDKYKVESLDKVCEMTIKISEYESEEKC